jgi:hypothetical protein
LKTLAIQAGILFAIYKFAPNALVKGAVLGVAGTIAAGYVPYLNGKDASGAAIA